MERAVPDSDCPTVNPTTALVIKLQKTSSILAASCLGMTSTISSSLSATNWAMAEGRYCRAWVQCCALIYKGSQQLIRRRAEDVKDGYSYQEFFHLFSAAATLGHG